VEVIGLAGLDGSGQELIMRACVGLLRPSIGQIYVNDLNLTGKVYREYMQSGVVFGAAGRLEEGLIAGLTLSEHVALVKENNWIIDWDEARHHCDQQIALYNVRGKSSDRIEQLSGGNQQRVLMALMPPQPLCLVLEQPTRGLDTDSARWIWQLLLARREKGTAIIFSSAELDELVTYSDRILVFYAGRVYEVPDVAQTSIDQLGHMIGGEFAASFRQVSGG
jgi:simple sugar transport system ATP-binding protein